MIGPKEPKTQDRTTVKGESGRMPAHLKGANAPAQAKAIAAASQSLSDQWWIKRQGRLSMSATWVPAHVVLRVPSATAAAIVESMDLTNIDAAFRKQVEDFLVATDKMKESFHRAYQTLTAPESQNREVQRILRAFQYHLELSIGAEDIAGKDSDGGPTVTQTLLVNRNMRANYDFQNQPKGKDAKRFVTLVTEQFVKKKKTGYAQMAANAVKGKDAAVVYELETGKDQDKAIVTHILGQSRDNKGEKRFEVWLKKLREVEGLPVFVADSKDAKEYLKKLNCLKGEIEQMLKARK